MSTCSESSCPFAFTDESEKIQNYGCLPTPMEIINMRVKHNKTWACHSNPKIPCVGALNYLSELGLDNKVVDPVLITDEDNWGLYK